MTTMELPKILAVAKICSCLTAAALFCTMSYVCFRIGATVDRQVGKVSKAAATKVDGAIALVNGHLSSMETLIDRRTGDALTRVDAALDLLDARTEEISRELTTTKDAVLVVGLNLAGRADSRMGELTEQVKILRSDVSPLLKSASSTMFQVEAAAPLFLDCDHNSDCLFNRYVGVAKSTETTMRDVSSSVPKFLTLADSIEENVNAGSHKYLEVAEDTDTFIKRLTPPKFPTWLRWTMGLAPPVAQTGASVVGIGAITGHFR